MECTHPCAHQATGGQARQYGATPAGTGGVLILELIINNLGCKKNIVMIEFASRGSLWDSGVAEVININASSSGYERHM